MKFKFEITCDNAAFTDFGRAPHDAIADYLRQAANLMEGEDYGECPVKRLVIDDNGNTIGKWVLK